MNLKIKSIPAACFMLIISNLATAAGANEISNYRQYSPQFSSSGQPTTKQLEAIAEEGFKRVIYLAFSDNHTAIENEDRVVKKLGMDYAHIPVDFDKPTVEDFEDFSAIMNRDKNIRTLLHCQINLRASAFSFLYRVIYADVSMARAKEDLDAIWQPDKVWYRFIVAVLAQHGMSQECDECDWGENEFS